jgi:hypothetical protein
MDVVCALFILLVPYMYVNHVLDNSSASFTNIYGSKTTYLYIALPYVLA